MSIFISNLQVKVKVKDASYFVSIVNILLNGILVLDLILCHECFVRFLLGLIKIWWQKVNAMLKHFTFNDNTNHHKVYCDAELSWRQIESCTNNNCIFLNKYDFVFYNIIQCQKNSLKFSIIIHKSINIWWQIKPSKFISKYNIV